MLNGILPNKEQTISNKKTINSQKRMGYDFTFSAPKSISIQGLVGNDINIIKAHDEAVKTALSELEKYISTRKRLELE